MRPDTAKTLYVVVNPPPRYEIVGLLQQRSYTPVNEFFEFGPPAAGEVPAEEAVREELQMIAGREHSERRRPFAAPDPVRRWSVTTVPVWPPASRSSVTIAVDAGTTGVRALVVDERARVVDVAYGELTQYFPQPGLGRARPRRDLDARCGPRWTRWPDGWPTTAGWPGPSASPTSARRWWPGTGAPVDPLHRAIVWQDRRTAAACRALTEAGHLPLVRERTGLVLDPYFSATKMQWLLGPGRAVPPAGDLALGTVDAWVLWNLTGGAGRRGVRHRRHQRLAHHALRHRGPAVVGRSSASSSASPRAPSPRCGRPAAGSGRVSEAALGADSPLRGVPDQRDGRRPARRPLRPGLLRPGHDQGHLRHRAASSS